MPFELHWEPNGVVRRYSGTLTDADVLDSNQAFMNDPRFDSLHYCIVDATQVTDAKVSDDTAVLVSAAHKGASLSNPNLLMAIVTANQHLLHFIELYTTTCEGFHVSTFTRLDQAKNWVTHTRIQTKPCLR